MTAEKGLSRKLPDGFVRFNADVGPHAVNALTKTLLGFDEVPYLATQGASVHVGRRGADLPIIKQCILIPSLEDQRSHFSEIGGLYDFYTKQIEVVEYVTTNGHAHVQGRAPEVMRHELSHSFNHNAYDISDFRRAGMAATRPLFSTMSASPGFMEAYHGDLRSLGGPEKATDRGFGYYVRLDLNDDFVRGADETATEQIASFRGGGVNRNIPSHFPRTNAWTLGFLGGHSAARAAHVPNQVRLFYEDYGTAGLHYLSHLDAVHQAVKSLSQFSYHLQRSPGVIYRNMERVFDLAQFEDKVLAFPPAVDPFLGEVLAHRKVMEVGQAGPKELAAFFIRSPDSLTSFRDTLAQVSDGRVKKLNRMSMRYFTKFEKPPGYKDLSNLRQREILANAQKDLPIAAHRKFKDLNLRHFARYVETASQIAEVVSNYSEIVTYPERFKLSQQVLRREIPSRARARTLSGFGALPGF